MREIKFRGKVLIGGEWRKGDLSTRTNTITDKGGFYRYVDPETIGQFTGLCDKNGKEIYEGDIVLQKGYNGKKIPMCVEFSCGAFIVGYHKGSSTKNTPMLINSKCEVIGNIYDNPELLEEGEK